MNIYIPIEIKVRELEGRNLLAFAAAERGHTVIIGEKKDTIGLAAKGKLPPGIVHMKSITPHDSMIRILKNLKIHGHNVTSQDEESGLLDESYDTFARLRFSEKTLASVEKVFGWGNHDTNSLKKMYPQFSDTFISTGSPRVDFWRKDFADYFQYTSVHNVLHDKPYIMIVSNFGSLLNENRFWNVMARLRQAGYFDREDNREFHEYENAAYQLNLVGEFVKMIRYLSLTYPNLNILVRPHPVESIEGWEKLIGDTYPNVHVNRDGTISRWIRSSVTIIHNGCTSALEAGASGLNRIAYRPLPHEIEREIPNLASTNVFNLDELKKVIDGILNDNTNDLDVASSKPDEILMHRFGNLQGQLAADRIVDEWERIARDNELKSASVDSILSVERGENRSANKKIKKTLVQIRNKIIPAKKNQKTQLLETGHKFPDFREEELSLLLSNLQKSLLRFDNVRYKRFDEKSYILYSDFNKH